MSSSAELAPKMCTRGFRLGTKLCRLWSTLPGLRWLLGLGLLPVLKTARCAAFYLPGLAPVNFCEADRDCYLQGED